MFQLQANMTQPYEALICLPDSNTDSTTISSATPTISSRTADRMRNVVRVIGIENHDSNLNLRVCGPQRNVSQAIKSAVKGIQLLGDVEDVNYSPWIENTENLVPPHQQSAPFLQYLWREKEI